MENFNQLVTNPKLLDKEKVEKLKGYSNKINEYNNMVKKLEEINLEDFDESGKY